MTGGSVVYDTEHPKQALCDDPEEGSGAGWREHVCPFMLTYG